MIANMGKDDAMAAGGDVDDLRLAFPPGAEPPFRTPVAALVATAVRKGRRRRIVTLSVKAALFAVPVIAAVVVFANVSPGTVTSTVRPASSPSYAPSQVTPSSTPTVTSTASFDRSAVYNQAAAYLQSFLTSWQKNGLYAAGQKYLDPSQRPNQTQGNPVLKSGTVTRTQPGEWVSADHFTVQADLDLRFSGDAGAWGNGANDRFVTFVRSSASAPYQMTFATGP